MSTSLKKSISENLNLGDDNSGSLNLDNLSKKLSGSAPRSSAGIYNKTASLLSSKPASNRLLTVPSGSASAFVKSALMPVASTVMVAPAGGSSFFRYLLVFLILAFLGLNLVLFLIKPVDSSFSQLYAPIANYFNNRKVDKASADKASADKASAAATSASATSASAAATSASAAATSASGAASTAVQTLQTALDNKTVTNNIDNKQNATRGEAPVKKLPVIPEADDSGSRLQANKPTSKAGYCYIGEDRGFRSCIEVGEGDVCMSGDIFPTQAICINPNLRE
jgi:hypothetical protein